MMFYFKKYEPQHPPQCLALLTCSLSRKKEGNSLTLHKQKRLLLPFELKGKLHYPLCYHKKVVEDLSSPWWQATTQWRCVCTAGCSICRVLALLLLKPNSKNKRKSPTSHLEFELSLPRP